MTNREQFFDLLGNRGVKRLPFFPDVSDWYKARRLPPDERNFYPTGGLISDSDGINTRQHDMPSEWASWTYLDFYRNYDWGLPVHIYDWCDFEPDGHDVVVTNEPDRTITEWKTPIGELRKVQRMAADGSMAITAHPVKTLEDLTILEYVVLHTKQQANPKLVRGVLDEIGDLGVADIVVGRSPFGKVVQEYLGLETTAFLYAEEPKRIHEFLELQERVDMEIIEFAAESDARVVIISDHADEHLINPRWFRELCIPFYRKACDIFHDAGKIVSTHLDGNIKGLLPLLPDTGFDLLDGCTPSPMNNYTPGQLGAALGPGQYAYCGVPSTFFAQELPDEAILESARDIHAGVGDRLIMNVGDVLPPNGSIEQVILLGQWCAGL